MLQKRLFSIISFTITFALVGILLFSKSVEARSLEQRFKEFMKGKNYQSAKDIYNSAKGDVLVGKVFGLKESTKDIVKNSLDGLKEEYLKGSISIKEFNATMKLISEFDSQTKELAEQTGKVVEDIENNKLITSEAQKLFTAGKYSEALKKLKAINENDKKGYDKAQALKAQITKIYKNNTYEKIDELIDAGKVEDAKSVLASVDNIFDQQCTDLETKADQYTSKTNFLIMVDLKSQVTDIFLGKKGDWRLIKSDMCSSGIAGDETPKGVFTITDRGAWFFTPRYGDGGEYWVRFYKTYLFHSLPMDINKNIIDTTLGKPASHGCVRLEVDEAKWIYDNIPSGTKVIVQ